MVVGVVLMIAGASLAAAPVAAGRMANALRFVPYSTEPRYVRYYRGAGVLLVAVGLLLAIAR